MSPRDIGAHPPSADRVLSASPTEPLCVSAHSGDAPLRVGNATLHLGNCLDILATLEPESVDSCVCDPPYHLTSIVKRFGAANAAPAQVGATGAYARASRGFMGQQWDGGDVAFRPETWEAVYRVLKPGAHLIAFGGSRTSHRMVCAIEDAGFEVRDDIAYLTASDTAVQNFLASLSDEQQRAFARCVEESGFGGRLSWIFGSGFPKSHDVAKGLRKAAKSARGAARRRLYLAAEEVEGWGTALKPGQEPICLARKPLEGSVAANVLRHGVGALNVDGCRIEVDDGEPNKRRPTGEGGGGNSIFGVGNTTHTGTLTQGRWPANIMHDGSDEVLAHFPVAPGQQAPESFTAPSSKTRHTYGERGRRPGGFGNIGADKGSPVPNGAMYADSGSAARFFYCAKTSANERHLGCEDLEKGNSHPTVKPVDLMRYLARLVTPKGGLVLDPFAGSGSTLIAASWEGFRSIGCELSPEYIDIARRRLAAAQKEIEDSRRQLTMFDGAEA